jgi:hypothetical protein
MKTYKRIFFLFLLLVVMSLLCLFLYRAYRYLSATQIEAFGVIPDDAALIMKGKNTAAVLDFNGEYQRFLPFIFSLSQENKIHTVLDSILLRERYKHFFQHTSFYLSLHSGGNGDDKLLFSLETSKGNNHFLVSFLDLVRNDYNLPTFVYRDNVVYSFPTREGILYINHQNGLLLMTYNENLRKL